MLLWSGQVSKCACMIASVFMLKVVVGNALTHNNTIKLFQFVATLLQCHVAVSDFVVHSAAATQWLCWKLLVKCWLLVLEIVVETAIGLLLLVLTTHSIIKAIARPGWHSSHFHHLISLHQQKYKTIWMKINLNNSNCYFMQIKKFLNSIKIKHI